MTSQQKHMGVISAASVGNIFQLCFFFIVFFFNVVLKNTLNYLLTAIQI